MKHLRFLIIFFYFPLVVLPQGGSIYTRSGLGDVFYSNSARRSAMGELGTALFDENQLSSLNPASWSKLNWTRFQATLNYNSIGLSSTDNSAFYSNARFAGFMLGIPIERSLGIAVLTGILPVTDVRYEVNEGSGSSEVSYTRNYRGDGGLSKVFIGSSYTLPFGFSVGGSLDYYIGNINHYSAIVFESSDYVNTTYVRTYKLSGIGGTFGIISNDLSKSLGLKLLTDLRLGATLSFSNKFQADSSLLTQSNSGDLTLISSKSNAKYPLLFTLGLSMELSQNYTIIFDYLNQAWSKYEFNGSKSLNLRDVQKISSGFEYKKSDASENSFWEHVALRGGLSFEQTQYSINGTGIDLYSVFGGFSIPLDPYNSIDIGIQYGIRGTKDFNLLKENIFKLNFGLSLGEPWFRR